MIITDDLKTLQKIFKDYEIRIVGGAVRDHILGIDPKDIDLSTNAIPSEMIELFNDANVKYIPTGICHGTMTAIINGNSYEITTLRNDLETDGRRSKVNFIKSWEEDAERRDFTYNAMSMDFDYKLYDYFNGRDDLKDNITRFIGDPNKRIQEDYLRILRYFRFQGKMDNPTFDQDSLDAIKNNVDGLSKVSAERIWIEMKKILSGKNVQVILQHMADSKVNEAIGLPDDVRGLDYNSRFGFKDIFKINGLKDNDNAVVNLSRIAKDVQIAELWKMSKQEKSLLNFLMTNNNVYSKLYFMGEISQFIMDGIDKEWIVLLANLLDEKGKESFIRDLEYPDCPVSGKDLLDIGIPQGKTIGSILEMISSQWKRNNFRDSKDELLKMAQSSLN